jgi:hypothetical protein
MRFRCNLCSQWPATLEFEDNAGACPKCGACEVPFVARLIDVHLMVVDARGPIRGGRGRQMVACQPARDHLAKSTLDLFSASDDPRAATCPRCRRTPLWKDRARQIDELARALAEIEGLPVSVMTDPPKKG